MKHTKCHQWRAIDGYRDTYQTCTVCNAKCIREDGRIIVFALPVESRFPPHRFEKGKTNHGQQ
jgi:hypothetical protein